MIKRFFHWKPATEREELFVMRMAQLVTGTIALTMTFYFVAMFLGY